MGGFYMLTGLVSVTFRQLKPEEIIGLVSQAGLDGIEWGGDIHVPHSDVKTAREVSKMTLDSGLKVASYGSYYRVGCGRGPGDFEGVLETACELGAPVVRVWAGDKDSGDADENWWNRVADESRSIAEMAEQYRIGIAYEFHGGTLTNTPESACSLLKAVNHKNIFTYWQPPINQNAEQRIEGLRLVRPWLKHVHVFNWVTLERRPLSEAEEIWTTYLKEASDCECDRYALLEFVKDDSPGQFMQDAKVLKKLVNAAG